MNVEPLLAPHIPALDFRGFLQDELMSLAQGYRHDPFHPVEPGIDRSIFNESASSRGQTFESMRQDSGAGSLDGDEALGNGARHPEVCVVNKESSNGRLPRSEETRALSEHILQMRGTWISSSRQEKLVAAKGFPEGWTVIVRMRWSDGRCYLEFRDYSSPDGKSWPTFRAASSHLISSLENMEIVGLVESKRTEVAAEDGREGAGEAREFVDIESGNEGKSETGSGRKRRRDAVKETSPEEVAAPMQEVVAPMQEVVAPIQVVVAPIQEVVANAIDVANGETQGTTGAEKENKSVAENEQRNSPPLQGDGPTQQSSGQPATPVPKKTPRGFECDLCGKMLRSKSQYWGHRSSHARKRKRGEEVSPVSLLGEKKAVEEGKTPLAEERNIVKNKGNEDAQPLSPIFGWLDEGCQECKIPVPGNELAICSWCEKEYHFGCVGRKVGEVLPSDWTCSTCIPV